MDKEKLIPIIIQTVQDAVRKDKLGNSKVSLAKQDIFLNIFFSFHGIVNDITRFETSNP